MTDLEKTCDDTLIGQMSAILKKVLDSLLADGVPAEEILARILERTTLKTLAYLQCEAYLESRGPG